MLRQYRRNLKRSVRRHLIGRYGDDVASTILTRAEDEYARLLPQIPYIGGRKNRLTRNLVGAVQFHALHLAMAQQGATLEEWGETMCRGMQTMLGRLPPVIYRLAVQGMFLFKGLRLRRIRKAASLSQQRRYPGDWVWQVVEGAGDDFDLGVDYTECGILKFMKAHNAQHLMPYLCHLDYVMLEPFGIELTRTQTLGYGGQKCDFRMKVGGNPPPAWPPRFPERDSGTP